MEFSGNRVNIIIQKLECLTAEMKCVKNSFNTGKESVKLSVNQRIGKLEIELESRIISKLSQNFSNMLDKRFIMITKKINKDERLDSLRKDFDRNIKTLTGSIESITEAVQAINI
jgi:hypothetical protein